MKQRAFRYFRHGLVLAGFLLAGPHRVSAQQTGDDVLLRALQDELARSMSRLQLEGVEKPYFVQYLVTEDETSSATSVFGALVASWQNINRTLYVEVRVGDYEFDNTEAVSPSLPFPLVVDADYDALRHDLWLATDLAYKQAVEQLARRRAFMQNKIEEEKISSLTREEPHTLLAPRPRFAAERADWERRVRAWSAVFREFPRVQQSSVTWQAQSTTKYLVNSEGTRVRQPASVVAVDAYATTQAADGMPLSHHHAAYARDFAQLPDDETITKSIRAMAEELTSLSAAPALESNYIGPVLFTGQAAAEVFAQLLVPQLTAPSSSFIDRLNRRVLPNFLTVYDDPTLMRGENFFLLGAYQVDDQGVPAQRVSLIEQGVLKNFLMSRRPRKGIVRSNGHGRAARFGATNPQPANFFVQTSGGKSDEELKVELRQMCRVQNLAWGIMVKRLYTVDGTGTALAAPVQAYKVYAEDGREELIRGVTINDVSARTLKEIVAAGANSYVHHRVFGRGDSPRGGGVPASISAPSVLIEEMEMRRVRGAQQKPALLTNPYFNAGEKQAEKQ